MGVSQERKRQHRMDLIGEKKKYPPKGVDYTTLLNNPNPHRKRLKQILPSEEGRNTHRLARFFPECREKI